MPRTFARLNEILPLTPLHDERSYERARRIAEGILRLSRRTRGQLDYLETLTILMESYERQHHAIDTSRLSPLEVLEFLIDQYSMTASDLGRLLGNRALGSAILRGDRDLSKAHIVKLAAHFHVSPAVFMPGPACQERVSPRQSLG